MNEDKYQPYFLGSRWHVVRGMAERTDYSYGYSASAGRPKKKVVNIGCNRYGAGRWEDYASQQNNPNFQTENPKPMCKTCSASNPPVVLNREVASNMTYEQLFTTLFSGRKVVIQQG